MAINYIISGTINNNTQDFLLIIDAVDTPNGKTLYTTNLHTIELYRGNSQKPFHINNILSRELIDKQEELPSFLDCLIEIEKFNISSNIKFKLGTYFDSTPSREIYFELKHFINTNSTKIP
ncbi:hypothetical protein [uncultured Flavobacterium sp.]|uniref:hypothetical protein n=1 Tax=uncultured Flavobacterium sp. TaxID=165435 RepID=UPI00308176B6